jgi:hypothetical protein
LRQHLGRRSDSRDEVGVAPAHHEVVLDLGQRIEHVRHVAGDQVRIGERECRRLIAPLVLGARRLQHEHVRADRADARYYARLHPLADCEHRHDRRHADHDAEQGQDGPEQVGM